MVKRSTRKRGGANEEDAPNALPAPNSEHQQLVIKNSSVPEGWEKVQMKNHPKVQWYENEATGDRQWYAPGENVIEPVDLKENKSLPSGWRIATHKNNTDPKQIWYESLNGNTSWEKPQGPLANTNNAPKANNASKNNTMKSIFNTLDKVTQNISNIQNKLKGGRSRKNRSRKNRSRKSRSRR